MHEYSVVQALMQQCEEHADANTATKIHKVVVKIGVMSGIEPHLLEVAFNTFKRNTICHDAEFIMQLQPLVIQCNHCHKSSELKAIHYCCQQCSSTNVTVTDGEEMYLMSLEME